MAYGSVFFPARADTDSVTLATTQSLTTVNTDAFTIEFWAMFANDNTSVSDTMFSAYDGDNTASLVFYIDSSGHDLSLAYGTSGSIGTGSGNRPSKHEWHHIAICKNGGNVQHFIDGVQVQNTNVSAFNVPDTPFYLGRGRAGGGMHGYLADVRVSNIARYDVNGYTLPTAPLSSDANTIWLFQVDITDTEANNLTDKSSYAHTATLDGNAVLSGWNPFDKGTIPLTAINTIKTEHSVAVEKVLLCPADPLVDRAILEDVEEANDDFTL